LSELVTAGGGFSAKTEAFFSKTVQTSSGSSPASFSIHIGDLSPGVKWPQREATIHLYPVSMLSISGAIHLIRQYTFMAMTESCLLLPLQEVRGTNACQI